MKKIKLFTLLIVFSALSLNLMAEPPNCIVRITKFNTNGEYAQYVSENHHSKPGNIYHDLACWDPGDNLCVFEEGEPCENIFYRLIPNNAVQDEEGNPILWVEINILNDLIEESMNEGKNRRKFLVEGAEGNILLIYRFSEDEGTQMMEVTIIIDFEI